MLFRGINFCVADGKEWSYTGLDVDLFGKSTRLVIVAEDWTGMVHDDMDGVNLLEHAKLRRITETAPAPCIMGMK
jgi:hypothetical protein